MIKWILSAYAVIAVVVCLLCFTGFAHEIKHKNQLDFFEVFAVIVTGILWLPACLYLWGTRKSLDDDDTNDQE